jgi:hypothetical protein
VVVAVAAELLGQVVMVSLMEMGDQLPLTPELGAVEVHLVVLLMVVMVAQVRS